MLLGIILTFSAFLVSMVSSKPVQDNLTHLPVEQYIEEVFHSLLQSVVPQILAGKHLESSVDDLIRKIEDTVTPTLVKALTSLIDSGKIETISDLQNLLHKFISSVPLGQLLREGQPQRRDDEDLMPNYLAIHFGGFGK